MNVFTQTPRDEPRATHYIEIVEPDPAACEPHALPPEGHYRLLSENLRAYAPAGDGHKGALLRYDLSATMSPPRSRILELLRPEDPGRDALEAIVRPVPRRGLTRPLDEDTRRFLQRALQSPSTLYSTTATSQPHHRPPEPSESDNESELASAADGTSHRARNSALERSLADELREAEEQASGGAHLTRCWGAHAGGATRWNASAWAAWHCPWRTTRRRARWAPRRAAWTRCWPRRATCTPSWPTSTRTCRRHQCARGDARRLRVRWGRRPERCATWMTWWRC